MYSLRPAGEDEVVYGRQSLLNVYEIRQTLADCLDESRPLATDGEERWNNLVRRRGDNYRRNQGLFDLSSSYQIVCSDDEEGEEDLNSLGSCDWTSNSSNHGEVRVVYHEVDDYHQAYEFAVNREEFIRSPTTVSTVLVEEFSSMHIFSRPPSDCLCPHCSPDETENRNPDGDLLVVRWPPSIEETIEEGEDAELVLPREDGQDAAQIIMQLIGDP